MKPTRRLRDSVSTRLARARKVCAGRPLLRILGGRGAAALLLGAALSIGGLTETLDGVHFLVQKNLDSLRVVREDDAGAKVIADVHDEFAAASLFKLSRALPDSLVSRQIALFDSRWVSLDAPPQAKARSVFGDEMARINDAIRRDFFANAIPYGDLIH